MHRPVRGCVRHIHEERFRPIMLVDEHRGVVADGIGEVIRLRRLVNRIVPYRDRPVVTRQRVGIPQAGCPVDDSIITVEPALQRPVELVGLILGMRVFGHMPLADHIGCIAGRLEGFGNCDAAAIQIAAIAVDALVVHHVANAGLMGIEPGQQRRARGAASARVVELREAQPLFGQTVQHGCLDLATVAADVGIAHVVRHDNDDIRLAAWLRRVRRGGVMQAPDQGRCPYDQQ